MVSYITHVFKYSHLQIGSHSILRLFLKFFDLVPGFPQDSSLINSFINWRKSSIPWAEFWFVGKVYERISKCCARIVSWRQRSVSAACVHATHNNTLQQTAAYCNTLQHTTTHCSILQHTATHCNTLQHTATHCNTPDV